MISGSKCPKSKHLEFWDFGDPRILFLEGVIFLSKFFTKSVARAQSVLVRTQPVLARAEPVLGPPKSSLGKASFPFINSSQNR